MDRWTYRFPLYSTGLRPLRYPLGPLPCLHHNHHSEISKQGKGTDDHLLFVGDWFPLAGILHLVTKWLAYMAWIKIASGIQNQVADIVADVVVFNDNWIICLVRRFDLPQALTNPHWLGRWINWICVSLHYHIQKKSWSFSLNSLHDS